MGNVQDFLSKHMFTNDNMVKKVAVSKRIADDDGNPLLFEVRAMGNNEFKALRKRFTKTLKNGAVEIDTSEMAMEMIINQTIEPNFKDAQSIYDAGVATPEQYVERVLLAGEVEMLARQILRVSGLSQDFNELIEEAKN